ncbi:MAG TPA: hypothetical protein VF700_02895, partial [Segetibacter sp.]
MLVYTPHCSPRVDYIFSTLLSALGVLNFSITTDRTSLINCQQAKINYSEQKVTQDEIWIKPVSLLFESEIKEQNKDCFHRNETKAFFQTSQCDFSFEIFAASFYLITRYEEYLPHKFDMYGRYAHKNSIAFIHDFLKLPLVNIWLQQFAELLLKKFPFLHLTPQAFHFLPTYDIDIAWSYLRKGWLRNAGGLIKSMMDGNWARVSERLHVLLRNQKD